jgi:hypothetical protein
MAGLLTDPSQPVQITCFDFSAADGIALRFTGPTLAVQPRVWFATNLIDAEWLPVSSLTEAVKSNGVFLRSFAVPTTNAAAFYRIVY